MRQMGGTGQWSTGAGVFLLLFFFFFFDFFFFNDTATTEIYTLSLHDALPISDRTKYFNFPRVGCDVSGDAMAHPMVQFRAGRPSHMDPPHCIFDYAGYF